MDKRCICSACLEARHETTVRETYEDHRVYLGVRASILQTARAMHLDIDHVCRVLGFDGLPADLPK